MKANPANSVAEHFFLFRLLFPSAAAGIESEIAQRLAALQVMKEDMEEKVYLKLRAEILSDLTAKPRSLFVPQFAVTLLILAYIALIFYAINAHRQELIWITLLGFIILLISWCRRMAWARARNSMDPSARLTVLAELLKENVISGDEAAAVRNQIANGM